jgi:hypothetical protein
MASGVSGRAARPWLTIRDPARWCGRNCGTPRHVDPKNLPSAGQILAALSHDRVGGERYDREWPGGALQTMG